MLLHQVSYLRHRDDRCDVFLGMLNWEKHHLRLNGANGIPLRTAALTSGVKPPLFKLYDARGCQLVHLQHINDVRCLCTFFNPDSPEL